MTESEDCQAFCCFFCDKFNKLNNNGQQNDRFYLSHDIASGSDITLCNKINKPPVLYKFRYVTQ